MYILGRNQRYNESYIKNNKIKLSNYCFNRMLAVFKDFYFPPPIETAGGNLELNKTSIINYANLQRLN